MWKKIDETSSSGESQRNFWIKFTWDVRCVNVSQIKVSSTMHEHRKMFDSLTSAGTTEKFPHSGKSYRIYHREVS